MLLDLSRFRGNIDQVDRLVDPADLARPGDEFRVVTPAHLVVEVRKDEQKVRLVGRLSAGLECACGRCLEPFGVAVDTPLDLLFLPFSASAGAAEGEVADDDVGVSFYRDDVIDLGDVMRDEFHLALPMKPLCRPDCKGLCPVCGVNRNRETCACQPTWVDPRMAGLKTLLDRSGPRSSD
jgi:uncharacterized protein